VLSEPDPRKAIFLLHFTPARAQIPGPAPDFKKPNMKIVEWSEKSNRFNYFNFPVRRWARLLVVLLKLGVLSAETLDPSGGVDQLLLSGEERVALGTDFNTDIGFGGTDGHFVAAGATNDGFFVIGMNSAFHLIQILLIWRSSSP
jgi:hypothetical protein